VGLMLGCKNAVLLLVELVTVLNHEVSEDCEA
jgi:hypothetical protein